MQVRGTTESSQRRVQLLVIRRCLRCEKTSEHVWAGRMRSDTEQRSGLRFCHRNTDSSSEQWDWKGASNGRAHLAERSG